MSDEVGGRAFAPLLGILLVALNLRAALVGVSPLLDQIRLDTGISEATAGMLTTIPVVCLAVFSPAVPRLVRKVGFERSILFSMAILIAGSLIRVLDPLTALFAGTAIVGIGISIGNVVLPALIKRDHDGRFGQVTGLYATALSVSAAVAAAVTIPLQVMFGLPWRYVLAVWALPALAAALVWVRQVDTAKPRTMAAASTHPAGNLHRDRLAWMVTLYLGIQSLVYYATAAWIPTMFSDNGLSDETAGAMLGLVNLAGLPTSLLVPILADRWTNQRSLSFAVSMLMAVALLGLMFAPVAAPAVWMILLGLAQGASLGLAFAFIGLRSRDESNASQLSSMSQSFGYALAAAGPFAMGLLFQLSQSWTLAFGLVLVCVVALTAAGSGAARNRYVGE